ncbi:CDP-alcohol phosphatidyltransferase family protein [Halanaeroarchaeum sulfurireducens]|uniref:CDP-diacylglycerol--glycerol-3-phosphate 3-phosphatidyltransferase n=1 Tax=Halanaeroarchaeum sulfurireducens TaxID=1604004 RepID=A0A0F7PEK6_9EURY|nr:CDP-alcohol phosphatidyltransferase family protein [Halanaeroarchaeum sulfurireducens]AKH98029.1 CDP-diacylglycerol--glycerol-3-phosphate 3-phosphatidyltransferase [Halanaeroarchaeum sulfurireducens]ALG82423.1 CDP-diacylglycerol--glycerol-3-phosphate 3-phosphatidyltransferase [Halanaeroarchaeum sulfurireducens]
MTLDRLRPLADRALRPFVAGSVRLGLTPDVVSVIAFVLAVGAAIGFYRATPLAYVVGALLVFLNGWLDLLDGALARQLAVDSRAGDLLDHVLDRYADVVIVGGLAAGIEGYALGFLSVTGVLLTSYLGTQAEAVGLTREYGGLLGRADRLALVGVTGLAMAIVPRVAGMSLVAWLLVLFAVVGHLTALQRFWGAWRDLSS